MFTTRAIILAAGLGTRMHSSLPKVLHSLMGHPMVWYALQAVRKATQERPVMVVGHGAEQVSQAVGNDAEYVLQEHALGTGHAVMQAGPLLRGKSDYVLVTYADMPLLRTETMVRLVQRQQENPGPMTLLTCIADDHRGFGRIVRDDQGRVQEIVEDAALTPCPAGDSRTEYGSVLLPRRLAVGIATTNPPFLTWGVLPDRSGGHGGPGWPGGGGAAH